MERINTESDKKHPMNVLVWIKMQIKSVGSTSALVISVTWKQARSKKTGCGGLVKRKGSDALF
jgi:hypothetical protein